jgi:hypothetical protein
MASMAIFTNCQVLALWVGPLREAKGMYYYKEHKFERVHDLQVCCWFLTVYLSHQIKFSSCSNHSKHILDNQPLPLSEKFLKLVAMLAVLYKYGPRSRPRTDPGSYDVCTTTNQIRFTESCKTQGFPRFPVAS